MGFGGKDFLGMDGISTGQALFMMDEERKAAAAARRAARTDAEDDRTDTDAEGPEEDTGQDG